jgi:WD40 repeat protein
MAGHHTTLRGHRDGVTCVALQKRALSLGGRSGAALASGSEDATVRIWDMRAQRSVRMIGPRAFDGAAVVSAQFSPTIAHEIAATAGGRLFVFDLRTDRVIVNDAMCVLDVLEHSDAGDEDAEEDDDEINAVSFSADGAFIATADDGGEINVFERRAGWARRACVVGHENIASSVAWCPAAAPHARVGDDRLPLLLSGAFDMSIALWQLRRPRDEVAAPPLRSVVRRVAIEGGDEGEDGAQLLNPPFVHAVAWSASGDAFAVGGGDGDVRVFWRRGAGAESAAKGVGGGTSADAASDGRGAAPFDPDDIDVVDDEDEQWALEVGGGDWQCGDPLRLSGGHRAAVNVVHWAQSPDVAWTALDVPAGAAAAASVDAPPQLLLSAGEDRAALLWRVPFSAADAASTAPRVVARIALARKPNCAVALGSSTVVVGDTSKELHVYAGVGRT